MKDDIRFYKEEHTHKYKRTVLMNSIIYGSSCILFGIINIILYLFCDDYLYIGLTVVLWLFFTNYSIIFIDCKVLQGKRILSLYEKMDFGNKIHQNLVFVEKADIEIINQLEFFKYYFKNAKNEISELYLYAYIEEEFVSGKQYDLALVNNFICEGRMYE